MSQEIRLVTIDTMTGEEGVMDMRVAEISGAAIAKAVQDKVQDDTGEPFEVECLFIARNGETTGAIVLKENNGHSIELSAGVFYTEFVK